MWGQMLPPYHRPLFWEITPPQGHIVQEKYSTFFSCAASAVGMANLHLESATKLMNCKNGPLGHILPCS